jgi:hypothetical protein
VIYIDFWVPSEPPGWQINCSRRQREAAVTFSLKTLDTDFFQAEIFASRPWWAIAFIINGEYEEILCVPYAATYQVRVEVGIKFSAPVFAVNYYFLICFYLKIILKEFSFSHSRASCTGR